MPAAFFVLSANVAIGLLRETLAEMFDPAIPFRQCEDAEHTCRYCDFREICKR